MIKVAFCDDELSILNELHILLDKYRVERNQELEYTTFQSPLELLNVIEKGTAFDVIFLDILMPGQTGINAATEIRNFDKNAKIIFLTSSTEYAVKSYTVGAYFYQVKPIVQETLFRLMDSAIAACEKEQGNSLVLRCKDGITRIQLKKLEYCEVNHRTLFIHLTDGQVLESNGSLDGLSKQLEHNTSFLRLHRSYLINLDHVQNLSYQCVTMSCRAEIPLPRGKYQDVKDTYLKYMCDSGGVVV